jgi:hypothetical protein
MVQWRDVVRKRFQGPSQGKCRLVGSTRPLGETSRVGSTRASLSFLHSHLAFLSTPHLSAVITAQTTPFLRRMDHHNLIRNIFSRNTSPPNSFANPSNTLQSYPEEQSQQFKQFQHVSPTQSLKDVPPSSPPAQVDSFLSNLTTPGQSSVNPNPPFQATAQPSATITTTSGPTSPASSFIALSAPTSMSKSTNTPPNPNLPGDSRQSALLSLISSVSPAGSSSSASGAPQQAPTPPGPPNRTGPTASAGSNAPGSINNESQGRLLLEQLMAG